MDVGIVSSRYAKALYRFAEENKEENQVYAEMKQLDRSFQAIEALSVALLSPVLSDAQKCSLLQKAVGTDKNGVTATVVRFIQLVVGRKRADLMHFIANSYISIYERAKNLITGSLVVAQPVSDEVAGRVQALVAARTKNKVNFNIYTDSAIGGGFILQYGDNRMDASIRGQLERLRRELK